MTLPTINNIGSGGVGFIGFTQGSSVSDVYYNPTATRGQDNPVLNVTGSGGLRPMLSDDEHIIVRKGTDADAELKLINAADFSVETIASTLRVSLGSPWATRRGSVTMDRSSSSMVSCRPRRRRLFSIGKRDAVPVPLDPGPSGSSRALAIGGNRHIVRIAGETGNGFVDPGERRPVGTLDDVRPGLRLRRQHRPDIVRLGVGGFSTSSRVGVTNLQPFTYATKGSFATVVYHANDTSGIAGPAIYTSRFKSIQGSVRAIPVSIGCRGADPGGQGGHDVPDLGVIEDVALYDPINSNGDIAFWASCRRRQAGGGGGDAQLCRGPPGARLYPPAFDPDSPLVEYVVADALDTVDRAKSITQIVMHATGGGETSTLKTFRGEKGIHYLINREGRVTQMTPEGSVANHAIPINHSSIGIELWTISSAMGPAPDISKMNTG